MPHSSPPPLKRLLVPPCTPAAPTVLGGLPKNRGVRGVTFSLICTPGTSLQTRATVPVCRPSFPCRLPFSQQVRNHVLLISVSSPKPWVLHKLPRKKYAGLRHCPTPGRSLPWRLWNLPREAFSPQCGTRWCLVSELVRRSYSQTTLDSCSSRARPYPVHRGFQGRGCPLATVPTNSQAENMVVFSLFYACSYLINTSSFLEEKKKNNEQQRGDPEAQWRVKISFLPPGCHLSSSENAMTKAHLLPHLPPCACVCAHAYNLYLW